MPTPIGHAFAGAALDPYVSPRTTWVTVVAAAAVTNVPDALLLTGIAAGLDRRLCEVLSHSLLVGAVAGGAALLVAVAVARLRGRPPQRPWRWGAWLAGLWTLHVILDTMSRELAPGMGVPLLWPLWSGDIHLFALFPSKVVETDSLAVFLRDLQSPGMRLAVLYELAVLGPLALVAGLVGWVRAKRR